MRVTTTSTSWVAYLDTGWAQDTYAIEVTFGANGFFEGTQTTASTGQVDRVTGYCAITSCYFTVEAAVGVTSETIRVENGNYHEIGTGQDDDGGNHRWWFENTLAPTARSAKGALPIRNRSVSSASGFAGAPRR
jgi:hypothetical protein